MYKCLPLYKHVQFGTKDAAPARGQASGMMRLLRRRPALDVSPRTPITRPNPRHLARTLRCGSSSAARQAGRSHIAAVLAAHGVKSFRHLPKGAHLRGVHECGKEVSVVHGGLLKPPQSLRREVGVSLLEGLAGVDRVPLFR